MKKKKFDFFGVVVGVFFVLLLLLLFSTYSKFSNTLGSPITIKFSDMDQFYDGEIREFLTVARRFAAQHEYISYEENLTGAYVCTNYSKDLHRLAKDLGFKTKIVRGCPEGLGSCHMWLRLEMDFEPQYGTFIDYSDDYPLYNWEWYPAYDNSDLRLKKERLEKEIQDIDAILLTRVEDT